ncbi:class II fumarate hydratase [Anaerococcus murdochii]|uniref:Fumarate hydratase class II n=1 Tax=Anaerococcus murdochii TaxID=411577 RepID=A0ABS7SY85_9FIRM|nr:class II fumarate hydratase [Anaerococcus murdochii]MBZ2386504.1 class II fumarate hydratase [Anaerococcus murdochii]
MDFRIEKDSMGEIKVANDKLWGAQTQRSYENFPQGVARMPLEQIKSMVIVKKAAAIVNNTQGKLDDAYKEAIVAACDKVLAGDFEDQFPLTVYQTGSGTQTNMNVNEVIAHLANQILGQDLIHPNDHVNMSQSTNDSFPTAIHLTSLKMINENLLPEVDALADEFYKRAEDFEGIIKTGRTHLQDATPLRLSDEIKTYGDLIKRDGDYIRESAKALEFLAIGGTAVGTGLNTKEGYDTKMAEVLSELTGLDLRADSNKFLQLSSKHGMAKAHVAIKILASDLLKIAEDIRFLSSGPRTGIGELIIPSNEPGSSIMPGKVNPTQVEMLAMICLEVMANDQAITMANGLGQLELNAYMPLIIYKMVDSVKILYKGLHSFNIHLVKGLAPNEEKIAENLEKSLMLVTALSPHIGYDKASQMAKFAHKEGISLREANQRIGFVTDEEFIKIVDPKKMV